MQTFARVDTGVVVEIVSIPDGAKISDFFHATIVAQLVACPASVAAGYTYANGSFTAPVVAAPTADQLIGWAKAKQQSVAASGVVVNIGTADVPLNVSVSTDPTNLILAQGAYSGAVADANATFQWVANGAAITLNAIQMIDLFKGVTAFLQATFATQAAVIAAIRAGTITTLDQVNTPPAPLAWPATA